MKALTLHQPWAWAVAHAGKRVESRSWRAPRNLVGQRFAVHAGLRVDPGAVGVIRKMGHDCPGPVTLTKGAVVAVATLAGVSNQPPVDVPAELVWWVGPFGWQLSEVVALTRPVLCRGAQGLWMLPDDVEQRVLEQVGQGEGRDDD